MLSGSPDPGIPLKPWSVEDEVRAFAGASELDSAVAALQLLPHGQPPFVVEVDQPFSRTGAETYCCFISVSTLKRDVSARWVLKACVATTGDLSRVVNDWVSRRQLLERHGVATPFLAGVHKATLLEEYVPYTWLDAVRHARGADRQALLNAGAGLMGVVSACGFPAVAVTHDLRSRGTDAVLVDFGQDLGPAGIAPPGSATELQELLLALERSDIGPPTAEELPLMLQAYEGAERSVAG